MILWIGLTICVSLSSAASQAFHLINASSIEEAGQVCRESRNGTLRTLYSYSVTPEQVFADMGHVNQIWNGFYIETDYLENTGCYRLKVNEAIDGGKIINCRMSIALCWRFCKSFHPEMHFIIQRYECHCMIGNHIPIMFESVNASRCTHRCENKYAEYCGSTDDTDVYNIYKIAQGPSTVSDIPGGRYCKGFYINGVTESVDCEEKRKRLCRGTNYISSYRLSWSVSTEACVDQGNASYMVSYVDINSTVLNLNRNQQMWLNEKIYHTNLDSLGGSTSLISDEKCEIIIRDGQRKRINCKDITQAYFLCLSDTEIQDNCLYDMRRTTESVTSTLLSSSSSPSSTQRTKSSVSSSGTFSPTNPTKSEESTNVSETKAEQNKKDNGDVGLTVGVTVGCVLILAVAGIISIVIYRKRIMVGGKREPINKSSETRNVTFQNSNENPENAYYHESSFDAPYGNGGINSHVTSTTIPEEDQGRNVYLAIQQNTSHSPEHLYSPLTVGGTNGISKENVPSQYEDTNPELARGPEKPKHSLEAYGYENLKMNI